MKKVIVSMLITLMSINVHALNISAGKVLTHKEWSDSGITFKIKDIQFQETSSITKAIQHEKIGFSKKMNEVISASNIMHKSEGVINMRTELMGAVKTHIENFSNKNRVYHIKSQMCAEATLRCVYTLDSIQLAPGGKIQSRVSIQLSEVYKNFGNKLTYIATSVESDGSSTLFQTESVNIINILKN
jgi:hypothetical protein